MSKPIRIKTAAAILGIDEKVIRGAIKAMALSSTGPGNSYVSLSSCVCYLAGVDAITNCPTCDAPIGITDPTAIEEG